MPLIVRNEEENDENILYKIDSQMMLSSQLKNTFCAECDCIPFPLLFLVMYQIKMRISTTIILRKYISKEKLNENCGQSKQ